MSSEDEYDDEDSQFSIELELSEGILSKTYKMAQDVITNKATGDGLERIREELDELKQERTEKMETSEYKGLFDGYINSRDAGVPDQQELYNIFQD